jgi:hypothetical protein
LQGRRRGEHEKDGEKRAATEVVIDDMILLDGKIAEVAPARRERDDLLDGQE